MSDSDIELAAQWDGEPEKLIGTLLMLNFIEGDEDKRKIHGWKEHNPYAFHAKARQERARHAANTRWEQCDRIRIVMLTAC